MKTWRWGKKSHALIYLLSFVYVQEHEVIRDAMWGNFPRQSVDDKVIGGELGPTKGGIQDRTPSATRAPYAASPAPSVPLQCLVCDASETYFLIFSSQSLFPTGLLPVTSIRLPWEKWAGWPHQCLETRLLKGVEPSSPVQVNVQQDFDSDYWLQSGKILSGFP